MLPIHKYINAYKANKEDVDNAIYNLCNKNTVEFYNCNGIQEDYSYGSFDVYPGTDDKKILGMAMGMFAVMFIILIAIFITAVYLLVKYWNNLTLPLAVISLILLFSFPIATIIIVLIFKKNRKVKK